MCVRECVRECVFVRARSCVCIAYTLISQSSPSQFDKFAEEGGAVAWQVWDPDHGRRNFQPLTN